MTASRGRRWTARGLLVLGTLLLIVSVFALFINRQALNADNWADTSTALLEDETIRTSVSAYLVDQAYANVDVAAELSAALPPRLKPLAGPAAGGLRTLATRVADEALGRPRVQELWRTANRVTMQQFINIAEGNSRAVTLNGNAVVLNLRVMLLDLVDRLGLPGSLSQRIPQSAGAITVMQADEVETMQNTVSALRGLALWLPILAFASLAGAVALYTGRRRRALMEAGLGLIVAGLLVLVGRSLAGDWLVGELTETASAEATASNVWDIGTAMLHDIAQAAVVLGIPVVLSAWLAGTTRPAVALRRAAAPTLRDRPGVAYGLAIGVLALFVAWGPIHATRLVIPVLTMLVLVVLGVYVLRRQTAEEFPDARAGATRASARARAQHAWETISAARRPAAPAPAPSAAAAPGAVAVQAAPDHVGQLERLARLHDSGSLTDEEFNTEKALVLAANGAPR